MENGGKKHKPVKKIYDNSLEKLRNNKNSYYSSQGYSVLLYFVFDLPKLKK